ncbi:MAG: HAD family hydrolase [Vulcanisaeta sp. AZ3]|jgi:phosphoglycolate phosphatase
MIVKALILDLDMTLVNTLPKFLSIVIEHAAKYGKRINVSVNYLLSIYYRDPSLSEVLQELSNDFQFWHECWLEYMKKRDYGQVFPRVLDALRALHDMGKRLLIATGRELECWRMTDELRYYGFAQLIEGCVSLGDLGPGHNKRDLIRKALDMLGTEPQMTVYVTDHPRDILMVNGLGTINIGVATWTNNFPTKLIIRSVAELPKVIVKLSRDY